MLKDMQIIEILTDILYYPFKWKIISFNKINETHKRELRIFQLCYRLIKHTIREYRPNEIYASQWLDLFITQSMQSTAENNLYAE